MPVPFDVKQCNAAKQPVTRIVLKVEPLTLKPSHAKIPGASFYTAVLHPTSSRAHSTRQWAAAVGLVTLGRCALFPPRHVAGRLQISELWYG